MIYIPKLRLLMCLVLLGMSPLAAKIESNVPKSFTKPTPKQLFGCYKVVLGGTMVFYAASSLYSSFMNNSSNLAGFFSSSCPALLEGVLGAHMIYFGGCEALKQPCRSKYLKFQSQLCNSIAFSRGIKSGLKGLSLLKTKVVNLL